VTKQCLEVVCRAAERSELPPAAVLARATRLEENDRVCLLDWPKVTWKNTYFRDVWSAVADKLIGERGGRPLSRRRREVILQNAEHALDKADRAAEIPALRQFAASQESSQPKRSARRSRWHTLQ
jgi:hypothetical protein